MFLLGTLGFAGAANAQFYGGPPPGACPPHATSCRGGGHVEWGRYGGGNSGYDDRRYYEPRRPMHPPRNRYYRTGPSYRSGPCGNEDIGDCALKSAAVGFGYRAGSILAEKAFGGGQQYRRREDVRIVDRRSYHGGSTKGCHVRMVLVKYPAGYDLKALSDDIGASICRGSFPEEGCEETAGGEVCWTTTARD